MVFLKLKIMNSEQGITNKQVKECMPSSFIIPCSLFDIIKNVYS